MLKQRIITALVLLGALIAITTNVNLLAFAAIAGALVLVGAWEWGAFALLTGVARLSFVVSLGVSMALLTAALGIAVSDSFDAELALGVSLLGTLFWSLMVAAISRYPESTNSWNDKSRISVMGMVALLCTWLGLVSLKALFANGALVIMVVIMVAAVDVGAFFAGKWLGRRKLAPALSPNKTWEGVWGGVALNLLVSIGFALALDHYVKPLSQLEFVAFAALALIVAFFAVIGDLVESMLKRNCEIKDSGAILPGHGGLLDRIDGLMAATPVCVAFMLVLLRGVAA